MVDTLNKSNSGAGDVTTLDKNGFFELDEETGQVVLKSFWRSARRLADANSQVITQLTLIKDSQNVFRSIVNRDPEVGSKKKEGE